MHILYFKIIPTISKKFDRNFWGPKLAHTLYSPLNLSELLLVTILVGKPSTTELNSPQHYCAPFETS